MFFPIFSYLPSDTWTLLVILSLINSTLLLLLLTNNHRSLPIGGINSYNIVSIILSTITTIETYITMTEYERSYYNKVGTSDATSRFRSQRNYYLSFFTLLLSVILL